MNIVSGSVKAHQQWRHEKARAVAHIIDQLGISICFTISDEAPAATGNLPGVAVRCAPVWISFPQGRVSGCQNEDIPILLAVLSELPAINTLYWSEESSMQVSLQYLIL